MAFVEGHRPAEDEVSGICACSRKRNGFNGRPSASTIWGGDSVGLNLAIRWIGLPV
jgi:hypothetical protein